MDLKRTVLNMKNLVTYYIHKGITSEEGVQVEWPVQEDGEILKETIYIGAYSFLKHENGGPAQICLPRSFSTAIPDGEFCYFTDRELAEELAKRFVRNSLASVGVNPNAVTRHWYGK